MDTNPAHPTTTPQDVAAAYVSAVDACDAEAMLALYADEAVVLDAFAWRQDRRGWDEQTRAWLGGMQRSLGLRTENLVVTVAGESDVAGLSMDVLYAGVDDTGEEHRLWNRLTWVLVRTPQGWRIAQEHTSVPLRMADLGADLRPVD
ncbi:hypothetical protein GCM10027418_28420 [Mariniluteicoccus endophyticus]